MGERNAYAQHITKENHIAIPRITQNLRNLVKPGKKKKHIVVRSRFDKVHSSANGIALIVRWDMLGAFCWHG